MLEYTDPIMEILHNLRHFLHHSPNNSELYRISDLKVMLYNWTE